MTTLHDFTLGADGGEANGALLQVGNNLYGLTSSGGASAGGTLFRYDTASNAFTILHSFGATGDGKWPNADLILSGSTVYGLTVQGGASGKGTIFRYDLSNDSYSVLHSFAGGASDGDRAMGSVAMLGSSLYGMTNMGGTANRGVIFKYDLGNQSYSVAHNFSGFYDGSNPTGSLTVVGGALFGTTDSGGVMGHGTLFTMDPATGTETVLLHFDSASALGLNHPVGRLILSDDKLFGLTQETAAFYGGAIYQFDLNTKSAHLLHELLWENANTPRGSLLLDAGNLYGTTEYTTSAGGGMLFSFTLPEPSVVGVGVAMLMMGRRRLRLPHAG